MHQQQAWRYVDRIEWRRVFNWYKNDNIQGAVAVAVAVVVYDEKKIDYKVKTCTWSISNLAIDIDYNFHDV